MKVVYHYQGFFTIRQVELIKKKEFVATAFDPQDKTFIVYIVSLTISIIISDIHPSCRVHIAFLNANKIFTTIFLEYFNFIVVFNSELTIKLLEYTRINNYIIDWINNKQLLYKSIQYLDPIIEDFKNIY